MYLLVRKSIITYSSQYQAVPAVTLNPVYLNGPVPRLCSVWFSLVQVCSGVQDSREVLGTAWYWDRTKLRQLVPRRVQGSTWQYQTEHDSTKWYEIVIYGMNWYVAVQTSMYQCVQVNWQTMFLINRCMYWFVLVCTGTYHYVKLTQQYVCVCTMLFWYKQVCSSM